MAAPKDRFKQHLEMTRRAWDDYHPVWAEAMRKKIPDRASRFRDGREDLDPLEKEMIGDVRGQDVLELSCGWDACQALSLANLGAVVTACDISPAAIDLARREAKEVGLQVEFVVCDSQTLEPMQDCAFDLVFAQYNFCYYEDLPTAFANWYRVLRDGGRLFTRSFHPVTACVKEEDGKVVITRDYYDKTPEYYKFNGTSHVPEYQSNLQAVEFPYSLSDQINAMVRAGFHLERMEEPLRRENEVPAGFPGELFMTALKLGGLRSHETEQAAPGDADEPRG